MRTLVIATNNKHKFAEISGILSDLRMKIVPLSDFGETPELLEEGETYAENALHKAATIARFTGQWSLADDTGLEVEALDGAPGLYSARYAGENVSFQQNREKMLGALRGVPQGKRSATFRCVIALVGPSGEKTLFEGAVRGEITETARGSGGFGYDPIFFVPEAGKTFAEMSDDEKNRISHRGRALTEVRAHLGPMAEATRRS